MTPTIVALATPPGTGGISIIRLSGPQSVHVADKIFRGKQPLAEVSGHTVSYGHVVTPDGQHFDEVLVSVFRSPRSYTREDVVEISCHGGMGMATGILGLLLHAGAVPAEPGEFTKRAFLNGRIDLTQAEAVMDVIHARTDASRKSAMSQLEGGLRRRLRPMRDALTGILSHIAAAIDFPEHDIDDVTAEDAHRVLSGVRAELQRMSGTFERGRLLRDGLRVVIAGKPNVGKSSLLNALSGRDRAIVTHIPGTTRDVLEERLQLGGVPVMLVDTAGIRETQDIVEQMGVERSRRAMEEADLCIFVADASRGLDNEDTAILSRLADRKTVALVNKMDIADAETLAEDICRTWGIRAFAVSAAEEKGLEVFVDYLSSAYAHGDVAIPEEGCITNVRHMYLLRQAQEAVDAAIGAFSSGMPLDLMSVDIMAAARSLGTITGDDVDDEVMHEVFSRFCIGK